MSLSWYRKLQPKIMPVVHVIIGASSEIPMHVSSSDHRNMLSNASGCPNHFKNSQGGFFNMLNPDLQSDLRSDHSRNTSFKVRQAALKLAHKARYHLKWKLPYGLGVILSILILHNLDYNTLVSWWMCKYFLVIRNLTQVTGKVRTNKHYSKTALNP